MTKLPLSVIILTYNEEQNIEECLQSIYEWTDQIFIVDSGSTDQTLDIAKRFTSNIYTNPFLNYASQFNWALKKLPIHNEWILRIDADERVTIDLREELLHTVPKLNHEITGLYLKRRIYFMGKWIRHGSIYPRWMLRIWRNGLGYCEERWMDEHIRITEGKTRRLRCDIIDENKKNINWWIGKHNSYATREAIDILNIKHNFINQDNVEPRFFGTQEQRKRWSKERIYVNLPLFVRPFLYFIYRYFIRLGFLDGKEGLLWHFLQGFWFRFLVDTKLFEIKRKCKKEGRHVKEIISELYGITI